MEDVPPTRPANILPENEIQPQSRSEDPAIQGSALPDDADDTSDAGRPTTSHEAIGWRAESLSKP